MLPTIKKNTSVQQKESAIAPSSTQPTKQPAGRRITLKKVLYHPLTWLAVGFHVLLLVVPFGGGANSDLAETPEEDSEAAIPVDLLNLSDIATSTPPPLEPPVAAPPPAVAPAARPPTAVAIGAASFRGTRGSGTADAQRRPW